MPSFLPDSLTAVSDSTIYAVLAAAAVIGLQPLLSISSPIFNRYPRLHLQRRLQHTITNLILTYLTTTPTLFTRPTVLATLAACTLLLTALQQLRGRSPAFNGAFVAACGSLLRSHEVAGGLPGGYWNVLSVLVCVGMNVLAPVAVPLSTVRLCLLYEAVGDPMAAIVGTAMTPPKASGGKTIAGSVGMLVVCSAVTVVYLVASGCPLSVSWLVVPPTVCAVVEHFTGRDDGWLQLDDNFTVPVITCIAVSLLHWASVLPVL